jgi:type II secretory pathway component PulF
VIEELTPRLITGLIILGVTLAPFLVLGAGWWRLSGLRRTQERVNCFLTLLEIGLQQGRTAEQTFLSIANQRVSDLGPRFDSFVDRLRQGGRLGDALDAVPELLPPPVRAMLKAGEELGDYRPVLPACRATLKDGAARSHSVFNGFIVLLFVSPVGPLLIAFMAIWIFPKLEDLGKDMTMGTLDWSMAWFDASVLLAKIITIVWVVMWIMDWLRRPDSWLNRVTAPILGFRLDQFRFRVPWLHKRMQRDFSTMLALLLDGGVPEEKALRLAAESTANRVFIARARRALGDLRQGVKLTEAVQWLDRAGEFRWRLSNVAGPGRGFGAALSGWHEALGAKAFQQEQAASQIITTGFVCLNGAMVGLLGLGFFHLLVAIMEEASW